MGWTLSANFVTKMISVTNFTFFSFAIFFQAEREKYLKKTYYVKPSTLKMYTLFNSGPKHMTKLSKFIRSIMSNF